MDTGDGPSLAAILAADVVGYSRLMGEDAAGTLAALRDLRDRVLVPAVEGHGGSLVKSLGDGWLAAFASASGAVGCAVAVQDALAQGGGLRLRVGVHLGDVARAEGDVYGDGVNVAARLEAIAPAGGVAISDAVRASLDGRLGGGFEDAGPRRLKNIAAPVRIWTRGGPLAAAPGGGDEPTTVAVTPFEAPGDLGGLAAGLAEDLAAALSRYRWLHVVGAEGAAAARYVVCGAVRGAGGRLRVSAHLAFADAGLRVWSDRWDRDAADPFAVQDDLVPVIVARVCAEIDAHEKSLIRARPVETLSARELAILANQLVSSARIERYDEAEALMARAVALEPDSAQSRIQQAMVTYVKALSAAWPPRETARAALAHAQKALDLDPRLANAHGLVAAIYGVLGEFDRAMDAAARTEALNPNAWGAPHGRAIACAFAPAARVADPAAHAAALLGHAERTLAMSSQTAFRAGHLFHAGLGRLMRDADGDLSEAVAALDRAATEPGAFWWASLFVALAELRRGCEAAARRRVAEALGVWPGLTSAAATALFGGSHVAEVWAAEFARLPEVGLPTG